MTMPGCTRVLLKARPTAAQLADRLAAPTPAGLELYLDRQDLLADGWLGRIRDAVDAVGPPANFVWIVEAPIRTLDGAFFDLTRDDADHRETLRRVIRVGAALGARAANVHLVAPTADLTRLTEESRQMALSQTRALLDLYCEECGRARLIPLVENIPPVGRMREGAFVFSPIGLAPADLEQVVADHAGLQLTVDVSHAALYLNWKRVAAAAVPPALEAVASFCRSDGGPADLNDYLSALVDQTVTIHVSNAAGILGEGLPYDTGEEDLDRALGPLVGRVPYFVTETVEPDPDRARGMRETQQRLLRLCQRGEIDE